MVTRYETIRVHDDFGPWSETHPTAPPLKEFLCCVRRDLRRLLLWGVLGALLLASTRVVITPTFSSSCMIAFPAAAPSLTGLLTGNGDMPPLALLSGALLIPQPGTGPETAIMLLTSRRNVKPLVERFDFEWARGLSAEDAARIYSRDYLSCRVGDKGNLEVKFTDPSPQRAQAALQAAMDGLALATEDLRLDPGRRAAEMLHLRLAEAEADHRGAQAKLAAFNSRNGNLPPEVHLSTLAQRYSMVEGDAVAAEVTAEAAGRAAARVTTALDGLIRAAQSPVDSGRLPIPRLYRAVAERVAGLAVLEKGYAGKHPAVESARRELDEYTRQLKAEVTRELASLRQGTSPYVSDLALMAVVSKARSEGLRQAATLLKEELVHIPDVQAEYIELRMDVEAHKRRVAIFQAEIQKARAVVARRGPQFLLMDPPDLPEVPSSKGFLRFAVIGMFWGVFFAGIRPYSAWMRQAQARKA